MLTVFWTKCVGDAWCSFERVDISNVRTTGVYIIWHGGNPGRVVRVGQGDISERLTAHRNDREILSYRNSGMLYVTWAAVPAQYLGGVERYLAELWKPLVGSRFPDVVPVAVNSPWAA